jgi:hypothetical protein
MSISVYKRPTPMDELEASVNGFLASLEGLQGVELGRALIDLHYVLDRLKILYVDLQIARGL